MVLKCPAPRVVVLVGPSRTEKTTWAHAHFGDNEVVSSDALRAMVGIGEGLSGPGSNVAAMTDKQYSAPPEMTIDLAKVYDATLHTNHGDISISLDAERSPQTVNNFVFLARDGYYSDCIFHRVISGFMVQGGDPTGTGTGGPGYRFRDEIEGQGDYSRGTLAMANAGPHTNGSQFFITHADAGLPHSYTIFGQVTKGMDVVDSIAASETDHADKPQDDVVISKVTISES